MKLDIEELKELEIEMEENEAVMKEMWLSLGTEHEDAGDRDWKFIFGIIQEEVQINILSVLITGYYFKYPML